MSELSKAYEPQAVEERWYADWLRRGFFTANPASTKPAFSIVIPPPNVTGVLTLGHVLNNTLQDILCRKARMEGKEVLWLPGTDHAGIATQNVVEKNLRKEGVMKHRDDLGREKLVERIWQWKEKHGGIIIQQLKKLGCSCDWSRERFTMDADYSHEVLETFVDLHRKGLIYRGKRMVNWCPASLTALSDEEVVPKAQKGFLYHFKVEVVEEPGTFLEIATTRPETIMGDTAVAVNPKDLRYNRLIGKHARRPLPIEDQASIPIIGDEHIDMEFGTGVLKVTPAHDKADYEIGQRHQLPILDIMQPNGTLNELAGRDFAGMDRFEARKLAVEKLREAGLLVKEQPYENNVGFSERADVPIEPRLSEQWFLSYPKSVAARNAVRSGALRYFPDRWEKVFDHWMENLQDWCVSRQLWWGHRIPVWTRTFADEALADRTEKLFRAAGNHVSLRREGLRFEIATTHNGLQTWLRSRGWQQDPDVLDTWFSSWLWPFATMNEKDLAKFYPTSVLVTGPDIIFFWVARMVMAGIEYTGKIPFRDVYFTGIIRDKQGRKMSKSLGNSPDPLDLIAKFGADGLRFGLMRIAPQGQDIRFDEQQIIEGRNFCNKLWNACRFRQMQSAINPDANPAAHELSLFARDLLSKLEATTREVSRALNEYQFSEAAQRIYDFVWGDFCDSFIEVAKADFGNPFSPRTNGTLATIDYTLNRVLRLLHPYTPFVTEELWHGLGMGGRGSIQFAPWPEAEMSCEPSPEVACFYAAVSKARNLRAEYNLPSNKKLRWLFKPAADAAWAVRELRALETLLNAETITILQGPPEKNAPVCLTEIGELYLPLEGLIDPVAEKARLEKELVKVEKELETTRNKLADENFTAKVPAEVLTEFHTREKAQAERVEQLRARVADLG